MKDKKKMVPEIRFKGFEDDWEQRKLSNMTQYKNGKGHEDRQVESGKLELVNLNSISIDGGLKYSGKFVDEADETLMKDDLVMILSDVGHGDLLGRVALIPEDNRFVLNQRVALLRTNETANPKFLFSYINAHQYYFKSQGAGMSQLNISKGSVENFTGFVPSLSEQKQISNLFKQLDKSITINKRKYDLLKRMKQAILDNLFPTGCREVPQIRFADLNKVWKRHKFEKIWKRTSKKNKDLKFSTSDILSVAKMKYSDAPKNSTTEYMKTYFVLKKGDIAFEGNKSKKYSFGRFVLNDVADGIVSHVFITFEPIIPMDIHFMKEYINYEKIMKHKLVKSTTKTLMMTTLNVRDIKKQILSLPSLDEQQKIGSFFQKINKTINLHQRKVTELNSLKKVLLNKLFV